MTLGETAPKRRETERPDGLASADSSAMARRAAVVVAVLAVAAGLWFARTPILIAFAGLLLAIVLYRTSHLLAEYLRMPRLVALAIVVVVVGLFLIFVLWGAGPTLANQVAQLAGAIARGASTLSKQIATFADQTNWLGDTDPIQLISKFLSPWGIATGATSVALSIVGLFSAGLIVLFFGIYLAADPDTYISLAGRLAPPERREAFLQMLYQTGGVLRRWLVGQGIAMAAIGSFTYVGLLILGVPIPFVLALFAGLAGFLPYLGPIIGAVPMVLVAGGEGLDLALWVVGLYAVVQFLESYLLTPLIQSRAVSLPPAVVIFSQLVLGAIFGLLGLALATPLVAAAVVPLRYLFGAPEAGDSKSLRAARRTQASVG